MPIKMDHVVTLEPYGNNQFDYNVYLPSLLWMVSGDVKVWYKSFLVDIDGTDSELVLLYLEEYYENFKRLLFQEKRYKNERCTIKLVVDAIIDIYDMCYENRGLVIIR